MYEVEFSKCNLIYSDLEQYYSMKYLIGRHLNKRTAEHAEHSFQMNTYRKRLANAYSQIISWICLLSILKKHEAKYIGCSYILAVFVVGRNKRTVGHHQVCTDSGYFCFSVLIWQVVKPKQWWCHFMNVLIEILSFLIVLY